MNFRRPATDKSEASKNPFRCWFPARLQSRLSSARTIQSMWWIDVQCIIPSRHRPLNMTFCSNRNFSICSFDEKLISLDTDLHLRIFFGTRAERDISVQGPRTSFLPVKPKVSSVKGRKSSFNPKFDVTRNFRQHRTKRDRLPSCSLSGIDLKSRFTPIKCLTNSRTCSAVRYVQFANFVTPGATVLCESVSYKSSDACHSTLPLSASRRFIQFLA